MQNIEPRRGKKIVIMTISIGLAVMAISSFFYRLKGPVTSSSPSASQSVAPASMTEGQSGEIQKYMAMLQDDPENIEALSGLGELFMAAESWDKSASFWQRYLNHKPEDEKAIYHYAIALLNQEKIHDSVAQFEQLVKLNPESYHGYYYLGMINVYYLKDAAKGKEYLQKVIDINPDHKEILDTVRSELDKI